mgnify:CR=1 FL=1
MIIIIILIEILIFILNIETSSTRIQFQGDQSLWNYLQKICHKEDLFKLQMMKIILIENIHTMNDSIDMNNRLRNRLEYDFDCPFDLFVIDEKKPENFYTNFLEKTDYRDLNLLIIFDLPNTITENEIESYLNSSIKILQIFYDQCYSCEPYMLAFITDNQQFNLTNCLYQSLSKSIQRLDRNFRLKIIAGNRNPKTMTTTTIHLRPVFDGCRMTNSVYIPQNDEDFLRIKTSYLKCNLKKQSLNVVVNDVS